MKMSLDGIEISQLEEIVEGWMKYITKILRESNEKVYFIKMRKIRKLAVNLINCIERNNLELEPKKL